MVKLIKLVGNSNNPRDKTNGVISNIFADSIRIQPKSRIALRSCQVVLAADNDKRAQFTVESTENKFGYRINGGISDDLAEVSIPVGTYDNANEVLHKMQIAANSTTPPTSNQTKFEGVHHQYSIGVDYKSVLTVYKANEDRANFANWYYEKGNPATSLNKLHIAESNNIDDDGTNYTTANGLATTGGSGVGLTVNIIANGTGNVTNVVVANAGNGGYMAGDTLTIQQGGSGNDCVFELLETEAYQLRTIPLVRSTQKFTVEAVGNFSWAATPLDDGSITYYAMGISGSPAAGYDYFTIINGVVLPSGVTPAIGDVVQILKSGPTITILVTSGGTNVVNVSADMIDQYLEEQNLNNYISAPPASSAILAGATTTSLELQGGSDVGISHSVHLNTQGIPIFRELGFTNGTIFNNTGAPAVIVSPNTAQGTLERSGVIVAIEGLDLETYVGSSNNTKGGINILDVLFADPDDLRNITQQINFPMPLDLKNQREVVIRDLRIRFLNNDLTPIAYTGQPSIVLELYGPDEST